MQGDIFWFTSHKVRVALLSCEEEVATAADADGVVRIMFRLSCFVRTQSTRTRRQLICIHLYKTFNSVTQFTVCVPSSQMRSTEQTAHIGNVHQALKLNVKVTAHNSKSCGGRRE